jgi:DNA-directed RNA polymerase subunit RPC12/RpoP
MDECPICMENIKEQEDVLITKCKHKFHASCLLQNTKTNGYKCPNCRSPLLSKPTPKNTTTVRETHVNIPGNNINSIIEIINTRPYGPNPRFADVSSRSHRDAMIDSFYGEVDTFRSTL